MSSKVEILKTTGGAASRKRAAAADGPTARKNLRSGLRSPRKALAPVATNRFGFTAPKEKPVGKDKPTAAEDEGEEEPAASEAGAAPPAVGVAKLVDTLMANQTEYDETLAPRSAVAGSDFKKKFADARDRVKVLKEKLGQALKERDAFVTGCLLQEKDLESKIAQNQKDASNAMAKEKELQEKVKSLQTLCDESTSNLAALTTENRSLQTKMDALGLLKQTATAEGERLGAELQRTEAARAEAVEAGRQKQSLIDEYGRSGADKGSQLEEAKAQLAEVRATAEALQVSKAQLETMKEQLHERAEAAERQAEHAGAESKRLAEELKEVRGQVNALELQKQTLDTQASFAGTERERLGDELKELKVKVDAKDAELSKALVSFGSAQQFNEMRSQQLGEEKKALEEQLHEMRGEGEALRGQSRELTASGVAAAKKVEELEAAVAEAQLTAEAATTAEQQARSEATAEGASAVLERELRAQLEVHMAALRTEHTAVSAQLGAVTSEGRAAAEQLAQQIEGMKEAETATREAERRARAGLDEQMVALEGEVKAMREINHELQSQAHGAKEEAGRQLKVVEAQHLVGAEKELGVLRLRLGEMESLRAQLQAREEDAEALRAKVAEGERMRRKMHNTIQELRGNVRVFARVRPFLPNDSDGSGGSVADMTPAITCCHEGTALTLLPPAAKSADGSDRSKLTGAEKEPFAFDKTFSQAASQEDVFNEVAEFVQSALDGYNVCLFSYGQTGSGKTHTMQGSADGQMRGIIPRSVEQIRLRTQELVEQGWQYTVNASFLEIYNETIRDLLADPSAAGKQAAAETKLDIKQGRNGNMDVPGLIEVPIICEGLEHVGGKEAPTLMDVEGLLSRAARNRSVAATKMNQESSRSHSVFVLKISAHNPAKGVKVQGMLNLCDLAGSERLSRSQATGQQLKEAQSINKSLSCLADVFSSISHKGAHIPFRNSKLTYLLQNCLQGNGKTMMMINLSPTEASFYESLSTLRFAKTVGQCELGKPKKQIGADAPAAGGAGAGAAAGGAKKAGMKRASVC
jgi:kinesin family protein C1